MKGYETKNTRVEHYQQAKQDSNSIERSNNNNNN